LAIDGTKVAVTSRKQVMTHKRIAKMTAAIDGKIAECMAGMDEADPAAIMITRSNCPPIQRAGLLTRPAPPG
jgi:hypothetical protein